MPQVTLEAADRRGRAEHLGYGGALRDVPLLGGRGVGVHVPDLPRGDPGVGKGPAHAVGDTGGFGVRDAAGVGGGGKAGHLGEDLGTARERRVERLEEQDAAPLAADDAVALHVEGARRLGRRIVEPGRGGVYDVEGP